jgi:transposase
MRGTEHKQQPLFSYVSQEDRIPQNHPLRKLREMIDPMLKVLSPQFEKLYADIGRPSIPPEYLLRALLVQILYTIRSERLLMEQLDYNLLFRWFVGLSMDDAVWDHSVFTKNRDRLLDGDIAVAFLEEVLGVARERKLLSDEHFTVDGTLIEAWAGQKSFQKRGKGPNRSTPDDPSNPTIDFHGEKRSNDTHQSTTDSESRLYRKGPGKEAKLSFMGHVIMDNRYGLAVSARYTQANGTAEREAAKEMIVDDIRTSRTDDRRITLGADKSFDVKDFVKELQEMNVTPHVAQNNKNRSSAIDQRTTRHVGYDISQRKRKLVEEIFGWVKTIGLMRKTRHKGTARGGWMFTLVVAAYNLIRIRNIAAATG